MIPWSFETNVADGYWGTSTLEVGGRGEGSLCCSLPNSPEGSRQKVCFESTHKSHCHCFWDLDDIPQSPLHSESGGASY